MDVCPECILRGPSGAAGGIRKRIAEADPIAAGAPEGESGAPPATTRWSAVLEARARAVESLESFPLAVRRAAIRETRERR